MKAADIADLLKTVAKDVRELLAKSLVKFEQRFAVIEQRLQDVPEQVSAEKLAEIFNKEIGEALAAPIGMRIDQVVERLAAVEDRAAIPGPKGDTGDAGQRGDAGDRGSDGAPGERGMDGDRGAPGELGQPGERGEPGERGIDGAPGKDVDEAALQLRIDAAVEQRVDAAVAKAVSAAMAALVLPKDGIDGKDGVDGVDGRDIDETSLQSRIDDAAAKAAVVAIGSIPVPRDGTDGKDGQDGKSVDELDLQRLVDASVEKTVTAAVATMPAPKDGVDGKDGKNGEDGRDALQIELLDAIDPAKSYPRGTFARWNGGVVRSFRATDALVEGERIEKSGWALALDGLSTMSAEPTGDPRDFVVRLVATSGKTVEHPVSVPTPIWRNVWTDREYKHGDLVTYDGSIWHCERATKAKPGTQASMPDWKLCTKKGRDGKDGEKGAKGDRGDDGRPGRDLTQIGFDGSKT